MTFKHNLPDYKCNGCGKILCVGQLDHLINEHNFKNNGYTQRHLADYFVKVGDD